MVRWLWRPGVLCLYAGGGLHKKNGGGVVGPHGRRLRIPCSMQFYSIDSGSLLLILEDWEPQF